MCNYSIDDVVADIGSLAQTHIVDYSLSRRLRQGIALDPSPPSSPSLEMPCRPASPANPALHLVLVSERTPLINDRKSVPSTRTPSPLRIAESNRSLASTSSLLEDPTLKAVARTRLLVAISYASFSGILSGMCLLFAKSGVELLLLTLKGMNQFWRWQAWMLVLGLIVFALLQLWYLHKALILADPTLVCPCE